MVPAQLWSATAESESDNLKTVDELVHMSEIEILTDFLPHQESAHLRLEFLHPFRLSLARLEALLVRPLRPACPAQHRPIP